MSVQQPLELRVLAGPQAGARIALTAGGRVDVGSLDASGCQVVLRDPQVTEQRVRLHVGVDDASLEVLSGRVLLGGRWLTAPASVAWARYAPIRLGDTVLAIGHDQDDGWARAESMALVPLDEAAAEELPPSARPHPDARTEAATEASPAVTAAAPRRRLETWLAIFGGALTLVASGLLAFVSVATPAHVGMESPAQRLTRLLQVPEFSGLRVVTAEGDRLRVQGDLLTNADRRRLEAQLSAAALTPVLDVRVGEQIAAGVREVFRMNGVVAETAGPTELAQVGTVRVVTRVADPAVLQHAEAVARRDVPGLSGLQVSNSPPAATPVPTPVTDDPGKRVASIVPGEAPYVVTVDGTRYFTGAMLPSGHRLSAISEQEVLLDKDGVVSSLKF